MASRSGTGETSSDSDSDILASHECQAVFRGDLAVLLECRVEHVTWMIGKETTAVRDGGKGSSRSVPRNGSKLDLMYNSSDDLDQ